jgi:hypothetical protein
MRLGASLFAALATLALACGCGTSVPAHQPAAPTVASQQTLTLWVGAANRICEHLELRQTEVIERFHGYPGGPLLRAMASASLEADRQVAALPLPREEPQRVAALSASYFKEVPPMEEAAAAIERGEPQAAAAALRRSHERAVANAAVARSLDLLNCVKTPLPRLRGRLQVI